jgi:hypothetical protein
MAQLRTVVEYKTIRPRTDTNKTGMCKEHDTAQDSQIRKLAAVDTLWKYDRVAAFRNSILWKRR